MRIIPEEWSTGWSSLKAMGGVVRARGYVFRQLLGFAIPFVVGGSFGWWIAPALGDRSKENILFAMVAGIIALGSLLAGFMVTLMLASGRVDQAPNLSLEELRAYVTRTKFLLVSQAQSLFAAVLCSVFAILWLAFVALGLDALSQTLVAAACFGFTALALLRAVLVPMQIFEIHEAYLDDSVQERIKAETDRFTPRHR